MGSSNGGALVSDRPENVVERAGSLEPNIQIAAERSPAWLVPGERISRNSIVSPRPVPRGLAA